MIIIFRDSLWASHGAGAAPGEFLRFQKLVNGFAKSYQDTLIEQSITLIKQRSSVGSYVAIIFMYYISDINM